MQSTVTKEFPRTDAHSIHIMDTVTYVSSIVFHPFQLPEVASNVYMYAMSLGTGLPLRLLSKVLRDDGCIPMARRADVKLVNSGESARRCPGQTF